MTDVSLTIRAGEIVGLTGLLGAGRTELALSIFGMLRPDSGTIASTVISCRLRSNRDAIAAGIGYRLRGSAVARSDPAAIDRRQLGDPGARQDLAARRPDLAERRRIRSSSRSGSAISPSRSAGRQTPSRRCRAATSSASRSPNGWRSGRRSSSSIRPTVGVDVGARAGIFEIVRELGGAGPGDPADLGRSAGGLLQRRPHPAHGGRPDRRRIRSAPQSTLAELEAAVYA